MIHMLNLQAAQIVITAVLIILIAAVIVDIFGFRGIGK